MRLALVIILSSFLSVVLGQSHLEKPQKEEALMQLMDLAYERMESEPDLAIENLMDAIVLAQELKDTVQLAHIHRAWGTIHYYLDDDKTALDHWIKGKNLAIASGDSGTISSLYNNLGNVYSNLNPDSSLFYYYHALRFHDPETPDDYTAMIYLNLALCYYDDFQLIDSSQVYTEKARDIYELLEDKEGMAGIYAQSSRILTDQDQNQESVEYARKALKLSRELKLTRLESNALDALRYAQANMGDYKAAYETADYFILFNDSVAATETMALVSDMERAFERQVADSEMAILEAENAKSDAELRQQNIVILSSAIGLTLMILMFVSISRGKKRSDELLLNILPFETAQELKATGKAQAKKLDKVTVLFTDFKGFTFMSEKLSPERLVEEIDFCFSEFDRIIERHGIEKIKTIGDSYMAAGGVPSPKETHAHDVVRASLEIQDFIAKTATDRKAKDQPYFDIRIGVSTGPLVAGIVGIKKFQYDIWGDTVNTASRMESAGEVGKVNISQSTYDLVKNDFNCVHRGKVQAKGKGEIDMYFVTT